MHACMELHYEVLTSAGNNQPSLQHPHSLDSITQYSCTEYLHIYAKNNTVCGHEVGIKVKGTKLKFLILPLTNIGLKPTIKLRTANT